jgi:hypothetical protein
MTLLLCLKIFTEEIRNLIDFKGENQIWAKFQVLKLISA